MIRARQWRRRVGRGGALGGVLALGLAASPGAAQERLRVTPDPIGATRAMVGVRSTEAGVPPLPVDALIPAPSVTTRGVPTGSGVGLTAARSLPMEGEQALVTTRGLAPTTAAVEAGPIWSGSDARNKCASVVSRVRWAGRSSGAACTCSAGVRSTAVNVSVGSMGSEDARTRCTDACGDVAWTGQWWTTVPGSMSVCQLRWTPSEPVEEEDEGVSVEEMEQVYGLLQEKVSQLGTLREERLARQREREEESKEVQGPSAVDVVDLLEGLHVDRAVPLTAAEILEIDPRVHRDGNPESGLYYYVPRRFDLAWNPETQYSLTTIYGMAGSDGGEGEVLMAARLETGVDAPELALARSLLIAYARRHVERGVMAIRELRPLPLAATSDVSLFGGAKNDFAVDPGKVSVQGLSDLLGAMDVSWATDVRRLLNLESLLRTDAGIHGTVTLHAAGKDPFERALPIEIQVADPNTFGRIPFDRAKGWTNRTHYPIRLLDLHALLLSPTDQGALRKHDPVVLSWALGDAKIAPGGSVEWDGRFVPAWVDQHAKRMWVRYAVQSDCAPCDDRTFDAKFIPPPPATQKVVVTTGDVFEATGAERIALVLRSPFLDSRRNRILEHPPVFLTRDGTETEVARLFLTERELSGDGKDEPFYEMRVEVVMRDGSLRRSTRWTPSRSLDFLLGSASLETLLAPAPEARP